MHDESARARTNGAGAAAVLAAGIGAFSIGVLALTGDAFSGVAHLLNFWNPTGPLSGVSDLAVIIWLISWLVLARLWVGKNLEQQWINLTAALLFLVGLLLTFPPLMDFLEGK